MNPKPMCMADEETMDHLLLRSKVAQALWSLIVRWFDYCWAFPCHLGELFQTWHLWTHSVRGRVMWTTSFHAVISTIWKERNFGCFEGKQTYQEDLIDRLKFTIASWASILLKFQGIPSNLFMHG